MFDCNAVEHPLRPGEKREETESSRCREMPAHLASVRLSQLSSPLLLRSLGTALFFNLNRLLLLRVPPRHFPLGLFLALDLFLPFHEATLATLCHNSPYLQTPQAIQTEPTVPWYGFACLSSRIHPMLAFGREHRFVSMLASSNKKSREPPHRLRN